MTVNIIVAVFSLAALAGCAVPQPGPADYEANRPIICESKAECDLMWQRAQVWIVKNSGYRIQSATDTVIFTFGPMRSDTKLAFQALKVPHANGRAEISITAACGNMFGCIVDPTVAKLRFKYFLQSGDGPLQP